MFETITYNKGTNIMSKKNVLKNASDRIAEHDAAASAAHAAAPAKKSGFIKHLAAAYMAFWTAIKRTLHYIFVRIPTMFWNWVRGINIVGLGNCTLLLAIIIMFSMLIGRVWDTMHGPAPQSAVQIAKPQAAAPKPIKPVTVDVPARVTVDASRDRLTIDMPLQRIARPAVKSGNIAAPAQRQPQGRVQAARTQQRPQQPQTQRQPIRTAPKRPLVANVQVHGDTIIDGAAPDGRVLKPGTRISGNVFLQNHRRYTLPCGLHIEGSLFLRNVGLLRFCDDFTVTGNIYVSRNSSFGPIPRTARLGGQVIF